MDETRWWKETVVYRIYPPRFADSGGDGIGDLAQITAELDYLTDLVVDALWLSPIFASPNDDTGDDISDYRSIMDEFGTIADLYALLDAAHRRHMRIVPGLVVDHTSAEHPWFRQSRCCKSDPKRDWCATVSGRGHNTISFANHDVPRPVSRFRTDNASREPAANLPNTAVLTRPGPTLLYQGDEIGMTSGALPSIDPYRDVETRLRYDRQVAEGKSRRQAPASVTARRRRLRKRHRHDVRRNVSGRHRRTGYGRQIARCLVYCEACDCVRVLIRHIQVGALECDGQGVGRASQAERR